MVLDECSVNKITVDTGSALGVLAVSREASPQIDWREWGLFPATAGHYSFDTWVAATQSCCAALKRLKDKSWASAEQLAEKCNALADKSNNINNNRTKKTVLFGWRKGGEKESSGSSSSVVHVVDTRLGLFLGMWSYNSSLSDVKVGGFVELRNLSEQEIKQVVSHSPVISCVEDELVQGLVPKSSWHGVVLVGYDQDGWILLNSYAGAHNYFKLRYNETRFSLVLLPILVE